MMNDKSRQNDIKIKKKNLTVPQVYHNENNVSFNYSNMRLNHNFQYLDYKLD